MRAHLPVLSLLFLVMGCGGGSSPSAVPKSFSTGVNHPYFDMTPGTTWIYEGKYNGQPLQEVVRVLDGTRAISGVESTGLLEGVFIDGRLIELTTEWFAQDLAGNIWKLGEESLERVNEEFVLSKDSWLAGIGQARPWMVLAAVPRVGDVYAGYRPTGIDQIHVLSVNETTTVPAGTFNDCIVVMENEDEPKDKDIILYAPGMGRVSEDSSTGRTELIKVHRK